MRARANASSMAGMIAQTALGRNRVHCRVNSLLTPTRKAGIGKSSQARSGVYF
jgi:hypothetical protein